MLTGLYHAFFLSDILGIKDIFLFIFLAVEQAAMENSGACLPTGLLTEPDIIVPLIELYLIRSFGQAREPSRACSTFVELQF